MRPSKLSVGNYMEMSIEETRGAFHHPTRAIKIDDGGGLDFGSATHGVANKILPPLTQLVEEMKEGKGREMGTEVAVSSPQNSPIGSARGRPLRVHVVAVDRL